MTQKPKHTLTCIEDLKPAPWNPRRIVAKAAEGLNTSLKEFGDISGIVWNARTGHLVSGHQRLEQLKKQHVRFVDGDLIAENGECFPVRIVDWPPEKEKAANIAANNQLIAGDFLPSLDPLLSEIKVSLDQSLFDMLRLGELAIKIENLPGVVSSTAAETQPGRRRRYCCWISDNDIVRIRGEIEAAGGTVECCDDNKNCHLGLRKLDPNAWIERRQKLVTQTAAKRKNRRGNAADDP